MEKLSNTPRRRRNRAGISLIEILISMFVLLFGLMGVAAIFPVASHYVQQGEKRERGTGLAQIAFEELQTRGMLDPTAWIMAGTNVQLQSNNQSNQNYSDQFINPETGYFNLAGKSFGPGYAFVIDPLGAAQGVRLPDSDMFPYLDSNQGTSAQNPWSSLSLPAAYSSLTSNRFPVRRVNLSTLNPITTGTPLRPYNRVPYPAKMSETIFSLRDDLSVELPRQGDHPGIQRWSINDNSTPLDPTDDLYLSRQYIGDYTWLATVVPSNLRALKAMQPAAAISGELYEVSVAVFYKREVAPSVTSGSTAGSERLIAAEFAGQGQLVFYDDPNVNDSETLETALEDVQPGNWVAVMGVERSKGTFLMKWYRILALEDEVSVTNLPGAGTGIDTRLAMVRGPDWPTTSTNGVAPYSNWDLRVAILPGIVDVHTRVMSLE